MIWYDIMLWPYHLNYESVPSPVPTSYTSTCSKTWGCQVEPKAHQFGDWSLAKSKKEFQFKQPELLHRASKKWLEAFEVRAQGVGLKAPNALQITIVCMSELHIMSYNSTVCANSESWNPATVNIHETYMFVDVFFMYFCHLRKLHPPSVLSKFHACGLGLRRTSAFNGRVGLFWSESNLYSIKLGQDLLVAFPERFKRTYSSRRPKLSPEKIGKSRHVHIDILESLRWRS